MLYWEVDLKQASKLLKLLRADLAGLDAEEFFDKWLDADAQEVTSINAADDASHTLGLMSHARLWSSRTPCGRRSATSACSPRSRASHASGSSRRHQRSRAYENVALPIGSGQTISQPLVVARMLEALSLAPTDRVLDVGTGSGYHAALLSLLVRPRVHGRAPPPSSERVAARHAPRPRDRQRHLPVGDGWDGLPEQAPFDAINVAAATGRGAPGARSSTSSPTAAGSWRRWVPRSSTCAGRATPATASSAGSSRRSSSSPSCGATSEN